MPEKKLILFVEDDPDIAKLGKVRLESAGYEVLLASDGMDALTKARSNKVDLIVLDLMLPKMDGYKVCRMLKFDAKYKKIPIIMLTARGAEEDKKLGKDSGADAYLVKPYEPETLLQNIKELIGKASSE